MRELISNWAENRKCMYQVSGEENEWLMNNNAIAFYGDYRGCIMMYGMLQGELPCKSAKRIFSIDKHLSIKSHTQHNMQNENIFIGTFEKRN